MRNNHWLCYAISAQIFALVPIIAVMFTFSFSSAFAAGVVNFDKNLATRYFEIAMDAVKTAGEVTVTVSGSSYVVKYATLDTHRAELLEAVLDYDKTVGAGAGNDEYVDEAAEIKAVLDSNAYDVTMVVVDAQYAADKAEAIGILNGLDVSAYSTEAMATTDADGCKTYVEHVQYLINDAVKRINATTFNSDSTVLTYADAKLIIDGVFNAYADADPAKLVVEKGYLGDGGAKVGLGVYEINNSFNVGFDVDGDSTNDTLAKFKTSFVEANKATAEANVAAVKAQIASAYASYVALHTTAADKVYASNVKKALEFLADEKVALDQTANWYFNTTNVDADRIATAITNVEEFKAKASRLASETDATGALVRDAEDVADYVTEGTINEYGTALGNTVTGYAPIATCLTNITKLYASLNDAKLAYEKKIRESFVADFLDDAEDGYYPTELAKVKALAEEYLTKVNAAATLEKVDDYDVTYFGSDIATYTTLGGSIGAVLEDSEVEALTGVTTLKNTAKDYVDFEITQITKTENRPYIGGAYAKLYEGIYALVGNSSARTKKDIEAMKDQAVALIKSLPTNAQVTAAKEAADDAIDALPTGTVTTADKAVIDAAIAAVNAYDDMTAESYATAYAVNAGKLTTATTKYAYAYNNEMSGKVKSVDSKDKAAVQALIDEIDAFVDDYGNAAAFTGNRTTLGGYLTKIKTDAADKVTAAIVAIPVISNITEANKDKVEAARALYDAYVTEYTDYTDYDYDNTATVTTDGFVADDFAYATLEEAETILGVNKTDSEEENVKALLADVTAKASSAKISKGIKVTVKADVSALEEAGYTVEYKFYRSTKKASGYVYKMTSKTGKYTNTAGKKGVKYYYKAKLVVKNAAGEVVAESPLKQCTYACRTWTK